LLPTLEYYNSVTPDHPIDAELIQAIVAEKRYGIEFVMAYRNTSYSHLNQYDKILASESNIAIYSLVQTVREMQEYFPVHVKDISSI